MGQRFGQHFLSSDAILDRIAALIAARHPLHLVEIGPGRGALTKKILPAATRITALEIDPALAAFLRTRFAAAAHLEIVNTDAMEVDLGSFGCDLVVGNLPYYVATPLIERSIRAGLPGIFLIQREVAVRMIAGPGTRDYGYLSVQTQFFSAPELMFVVPPGAFKPPPKVESAVIQLIPRNRAADLGITDLEAFLRFLRDCFTQKRKTLRNNLRAAYPIGNEPEANLRAEQLTLEQFAGLWHRLSAGRHETDR